MSILTAEDIVRVISLLPRDRIYHYINPRTRTQLKIVSVTLPEGPIVIKRFDPQAGENEIGAEEESISSQMIWRVANAFRKDVPVNLDRVLSGSYNTRSALETLLAHTPQYYVSYPGRIESISSHTDIKRGHKHLIWTPDQPHDVGIVKTRESDLVISEMPGQEVIYEALTVPEMADSDMDIEMKRRHTQIQIAIIMIGRHLGFKTWVAQNDLGILYKEKRLAETEGVIPTLKEGTWISSWAEAIKAALLIDCIWFKNGKLMPAVIEVEHSTGVLSGLTRMKSFQDVVPPIATRYVIAAPDEDRGKVVTSISLPQFQSLNARYFPYSAVEELWSLCERRRIKGVTEDFLDSFMEQVASN